jgi:hypothetical protein
MTKIASKTPIIGEIIARTERKRVNTVQVKNGAKWQSYSLHDSNIQYCELDAPRVGAVVRFIPSTIPGVAHVLPFAFQAEVFENIESLWAKDAAAATAVDMLSGTKSEARS